MSRQIQIRRGTAAEHENFIGAIGEITMDTDTKTLRVHDGETVGGILLARADEIPQSTGLSDDYDFVIERSVPDTNPWYRKYKSGWVEQGGTITAASASVVSVTMPVDMKGSLSSAAYFAQAAALVSSNNTRIVQLADASTAKTLKLVTNSGFICFWEVKGYHA